ncbi:LysR substrate-binding domain-containing protein [Caballeronia sp. LjRoot34]|uniref:LysR family transcriptional regulator n=1 Tax=Caballeronia sp. LjRoot34 TaxID=3342325 RepID=UPI003ED11712
MEYDNIDKHERINPHLDVRDLRFFQAVAEDLHFHRAAARLHIAQPHLSAHIRQLEERLGVQLLERSSRSVRLTLAGEEFLERARFILNQLEEAVAVARRTEEGIQGRIRIGFATAAGFQILPSILATFRKRCPRVEIWVGGVLTDIQIRMLLEGKLDFGFVRPPVAAGRLSTMTLGRAGMVAALPPGHRLLARENLSLRDLSKETFIGFAPGATDRLNERIRMICHEAGLRPDPGLHANDTYSILALVASGFGVAILPEWTASTTQFHVQFKAIKDPTLVADIALAWCSDNAAPAHRLFREIAQSMRPDLATGDIQSSPGPADL